MNAMFSPYLWFILFGRMLSALFPVMCVLLVFSVKGACYFKKSSAFRLVLAFTFLDLAIRFLLFFSGVPYQGRYFYPFVIICTIPAATGFIWLLEFLAKYELKTGWLTPVKIAVGLLFVVSAIHIGKALNPPDKKKYLDQIPEAIRELCPKNEKPILISPFKDIRIAYYADASWFKFVRQDLVNYTENAILQVKAGGSAESDAINPDDEYKADKMLKVPIGSELNISLVKEYPFNRGMIRFYRNGDEQPEYLQVFTNSRKDASGWKLLWEGDYCDNIRFLGWIGTSIRIAAKSQQEWTLSKIELILDDKWLILRQGKGVNAGYWYPALPPEDIDHFGSQIKKLGGSNVFFLNNQKDEVFQNIFKKNDLTFPLKFIKEFKYRKDIYVLYQGQD